MLVPDCPCNSPLPRKSPVKTVKSPPPRAMVNVCSGEINKFAVCSGKTKGGWRFSAYRTRQKRVDKARRRLRCLAGLGSISWGTTNLHVAVETDGALLLAVSLAGCGSYSMFDPSSFNSSGFGSSKSSDWKNTTDNSSANADPASTASTAPTTPSRNDTEPLNSLFARAAQNQTNAPHPTPAPAASATAKPVVVADARDTTVAPPATQSVNVTPRGRAYLFRGIAGLIYSRGMDK